MTLSDHSHLDTCAARYCNTLDLRANMHRIAGRRGYFCDACARRLGAVVAPNTDYEDLP